MTVEAYKEELEGILGRVHEEARGSVELKPTSEATADDQDEQTIRNDRISVDKASSNGSQHDTPLNIELQQLHAKNTEQAQIINDLEASLYKQGWAAFVLSLEARLRSRDGFG